MRSRIRANIGAFSDCVQECLRASGYSQKELADALGLHEKVLSRKLNGSNNAYLTHLEVQRIVTTLAGWHTITTQDEVFHLLELAQVEPTIFSADEWERSPLDTLAKKHVHATSSSASAALPFQHNLPASTTRLIGREWDVERLRQLLGRGEVRLVTLAGSGGSGKTRLAQQVANELVGAFAQGVWFVALAGVSDPALVPMSIMQALNTQPMPGFSALQGLLTYLRNKQLLLVLDNFEQVGEAASIVDEMLAAAPGLKVLVTSRVVLRLNGEHEFSVTPLDVPDPSIALGKEELLQYGAIQLFVERAKAVVPGFALSAENAAAIAQICARVDGLPLALELAAARVKVLPPALLLERLTKARLLVLTNGARNLPGRQQTLRNTITWSYSLLSSSEQAWFRRLGVFSGGWSLEAAEAIMQDTAADQEEAAVSGFPLDMLGRLVDSSLLVRVPAADGQARFTMLETLREYALERLTAEGEFERQRDWHARYYLGEAEGAEVGLRGPQQLVWLARLTADRDNFRAALEWALQRAKGGLRIRAFPSTWQEPGAESRTAAGGRTFSAKADAVADLPGIELCLRLAAALRHYWEWQGNLTEARHWLSAALETPLEDGAGETVLAARAKALSEDSRLVCLQDEQARAIALAEESIALWRQLDDPVGLATALLHRGWAAHAMGEYETARCAYQEALGHFSVTDSPWLRGQVFVYLAAAAAFTGNFEQMRSFYRQSWELFEQIGDKSAIADVLKDQGSMLLLEGNCMEAIDCLVKSIQLSYELDHRQYITTGMCTLSLAFGLRMKPDPVQASIQSAQVEGAAATLEEAIGLTSWTKNNPLVQMIREQIRSRVDEQTWEAAWATGRALTLEQAVELAHQFGGGGH